MDVYRKKRYVILIAAIICLSFFGCSSSKSEKLALANPLQASKREYSIAMITDTQLYSQNNPEIFYKMTQYLFDNKKALNLSYVMHTGDLVEKVNDENQWKVASDAMFTLKDIPHGVLAGNHDTDPKADCKHKNYCKYFGQWRYKDCKWYGESYKNNCAHYDLVKIGKTNFIFVYLSDAPTQDYIDFANAAFQKHPDHVGVLCVHNYITKDKVLSNIGEDLQKNIVAKNKNVYMVFCGHSFTNACIPAQFDDDSDGSNDRTVYQIIANFQHIPDSGYMLIMKIDESKKIINGYIYSPITNNYLSSGNEVSKINFSFEVPWDI